MKKLISVVLLFCFILCSVPAYAIEDVRSIAYQQYFSVDAIFYTEDDYRNDFLTYSDTENHFLFSISDGNIYYKDSIVTGRIGNHEVFFFAAGKTIYRYHLASHVVDELYSNDDMIWFYPITSYSVLFAEDHKANAQYISTVACSDTVDKTLSYYYCSALDNTVSYCADPQHTLDITGIPGAYNVILPTREDVYYINGKQIPHASYPVGSTYSGTFQNAPQCHGFALFIYDYLWGSTDYGNYIDPIDISDANDAKTALQNRPAGTLVRVGPSLHTMIIVSTSSSGIYVYHANWTGGKVALTNFTYANFATRWSKIRFMYDPS